MSVPGLGLPAGRDRMVAGPPGFGAVASSHTAPELWQDRAAGQGTGGQDRRTGGQGSTTQSWCHLVVSRIPVTQPDSRCGDTAGQSSRTEQTVPQWHSRTKPQRAGQPLRGLNGRSVAQPGLLVTPGRPKSQHLERQPVLVPLVLP